MINKPVIKLAIQSIEPLNKPDWAEYNLTRIKIASIDKSKDLAGFDLEAARKEHPDHLFVKVFAIRENEVNDNGDAFSKSELQKAYQTFVGVPIFTNHQNDDVEKAKGKCVHSWYDEKKGGIYIISMIDKVAYPRLARGIAEKYIAGSSMGAAVDYSCCSICHNKSNVADEYCEHIRNQKSRKISAVVPCKYHESKGEPKDDCPVCGQEYAEYKVGSVNKFKHSESQVYEWNYGIKFIEDSFVVNPACHDCLVQDILNPDAVNRKIADIMEKLDKMKKSASCTTGCNLEKFAGEKELSFLEEAMNKIIVVSKSLMAQNKQVSMEYVSNLVDVLANLQTTADELTEMGYGELPSPDPSEVESMEVPSEEELTAETQQPAPEQQPQGSAMQPQVPPAGQPVVTQPAPGVMTEQFGDLGSVTKPKFSSVVKKKKEDFLQASAIIVGKLDELQEKYTEMENIHKKENSTMSDTKQGNSEPTIEKVAGPEHRIDVINEKQLDDAEFTGERQDEKYPKVITEKQMNSPERDVNVTTSESPQPRQDDSPDVITEKQFDSISGTHVARWDDFPGVITEKQWTETSRRLGSELSKDQSNIISEKQLIDFLDHHRYVERDTITEKQLNEDALTTTGDLSRWAYVYDADRLVKSAADAMSDAIAYYGYTPDEIKQASAFITENPKNRNKAAYLTLINALPHKKAARENEKARYEYFAKTANKEVRPEVVDALILSMADAVSDMSADDLIDTVSHVAYSDKAFVKVDKMASDKMNSTRERKEGSNKINALKNALANLGTDKEDDGLYEVRAHLDDLGVTDQSDTSKVSQAAYNFANIKIAESVGENVETALMNVKTNKETGQVVSLLKEATKLTADESEAWGQAKMAWNFDKKKDDDDDDDDKKEDKKEDDEKDDDKESEATEEVVTAERNEIVKEAQLLGGEMGGQAGAAQGPGAGAAAPQPPEAGGAPLESFEDSDLGGELEGEGDLMPKPPGTTCHVCTSEDVDVAGGQGRCNNCGAKWTYEIVTKTLEWPETLETTKDPVIGDEEEAFGEEGGFEMPEVPEPGAAAPPPVPAAPAMPAAASTNNSKMTKTAAAEYAEFAEFMRKNGRFASTTRITPEMIAKAKESKIALGSVSPLTGSTNTIQLANGDRICLDTGSQYTLTYKVDKDDPKRVLARWIWSPEGIKVGCSQCERGRMAFVEALSKHDITEEAFDAMGLKEKGDTILKLKADGSIKTIKTASKEESVLSMVKEASVSLEDDFPMESCVQKLANRYGESAVALSGPCEGKNLADCVCKSLKKAGVYSNGLALKVADVWKDKSSISECLEDFVRLGHDLKTASSICDTMKTKYAQFDDEFTEDVEGVIDEDPEFVEDEFGGGEEDDFGMGEEVGPFEDDGMEELGGDDVAKALADLARALGKEDAVTDELSGGGEMGEDLGVEPEGEMVVDVTDEIMPGEEGGIEDGMDIVEEDGFPGSPEEDAIDEEVGIDEKEDMGIGGEEECAGGEVAPMEGGEVAPEGAPMEGGELAPTKGGEVENEAPKEKNDNLGVMNEEEVNAPVEKEGDDDDDDDDDDEQVCPKCKCKCNKCACEESDQMTYSEQEAAIMRHGYIGKTDELNHLDFSKLEGLLDKQADAVKSKPAQDVAPGQISGKTSIGDEDAFSADKPSAPSKGDASKIKNEEPPKAEKATVPVSDARMGGEKSEPDLKPELDDVATGGDEGQGTSRAASTKERMNRLADSIIAQTQIQRKQIQDDEDTKPYSGDSFIGNEKDSIGDVPAAKPAGEQGIPRSDAFIGNEKESIGEKPSEKDMPDIPTKDDRIGGETDNEVLKPEKDNEATGNVKEMSASTEVNGEAIRIAGRMLQDGKIDVNSLSTKIAELQRYQIEQLKDFEKNIFETKGLEAKSSGLEQAPVIADSANMPKVASTKDELVGAIQGLFKLDRCNKEAQQDNNIQLRKEHGML